MSDGLKLVGEVLKGVILPSADPTKKPQSGKPTPPLTDEEYECATCGDAGYLRVTAVTAGQPGSVVRCLDCNKERPTGVPAARAAESFESFDLSQNLSMKVARDRCMAVADGEAWCALLAGPDSFGSGKTHLSIAALNRQGRGSFWKVPDFLAWLRHQVFVEKMPLEDLIEEYRFGEALLVFDDLGTENPTEFACEQLYRVLDSRYELKLPTIITTNQDIDRINERIRSRFREGLVVCEGRDIRARGGLQVAAAGAGD